MICLVTCQQVSLPQKNYSGDTSSIKVRNFSSGTMSEYKNDPDFQYELVAEPPQSLWDRFWSWFWQKAGEILNTDAGNRIAKTIVIVVSIAILLFFIGKLTGMTRAGIFGKDSKAGQLRYSIHSEDIHDINFEAAIQQAIDDRNFRLAVRMLYLQSLKSLADRGKINWQLNKTNVAYVHELQGTAYQLIFRDLTWQFERNWYGDVPISEEEFAGVRGQFNMFNQQLA